MESYPVTVMGIELSVSPTGATFRRGIFVAKMNRAGGTEKWWWTLSVGNEGGGGTGNSIAWPVGELPDSAQKAADEITKAWRSTLRDLGQMIREAENEKGKTR